MLQYRRSDAPEAMVRATEAYEKKFDIHFHSLLHFSKTTLNRLHCAEEDSNALPASVTVASRSDQSILQEMSALERVANSPAPTHMQRERYRAALVSIYQKLPSPHPGDVSADAPILRVGVQREGKILGEKLGWLPPDRSLYPDAKRVPFDGGLIVGISDVSELPPMKSIDACFIIDGAIASGATTIAIIEILRYVTSSFHVFSVHATFEGLRAIARYAEQAQLDVAVTVGHATAGLNSKFYAIDESADENRMVVGDLGDTISDLDCEG